MKKTVFNVSEEKLSKLAVLIDADNASAKDIKNILDEITKFGEATVKRIYGNFTDQNLSVWKACINDLAIKPMQQFAFTKGKNATDGFMFIDAMDLLYTGRFDGFCIVSSDSDFTALAIRIKEQGATVYGFGKKQTPVSFRNACSQFIYVENLSHEDSLDEKSDKTTKVESKAVKKSDMVVLEHKSSEQVLPIDKIEQIFDNQDSDWITVAAFGSQWKLLQTDFDPRNFGCKKVSDLVKKFDDIFEVEERKSSNDHKHLYVRLKKIS